MGKNANMNSINENEARSALKKNEGKAKELLKDKDKMDMFLEDLEKKLRSLDAIPVIGPVFGDIPLLIALIRSYMKGEYTEIPIGSLVAIVASLIYFVSPIDLIPDILPVIGLTDDVVVLTLALSIVHTDLEQYKQWKEEHYQ